ncbi:MAG: DUF1858 domain-containing protein [Nanoarchaeota archaeon]|nr:DUF1858 domain-containing protein [Nanoarchaeota archaeon]
MKAKTAKTSLIKNISKKNSFAEVLEKFPESAEVFLEAGMHCISCPMAMMESIEEGCKAHGIDVNEIIEKINKKIKK